MENKELFRVEHISKTFEGASLIEGCTLCVYKGEIRGIIGLNSSNKEVLADVMAGITPLDEGKMFLEEEVYLPTSRQHAESSGVFYIGKDLGLQYNWDILTNLSITPVNKRKIIVRKKDINKNIEEILSTVILNKKADTKVYGLTILEQQKITIARALLRNAKLIILNFDWEMYTIREMLDFMQIIVNLKNKEIGVVLVGFAHDLLTAVCDFVTIMRNGIMVGNFSKDEFDNQKILNIMLGYEFGGKSLFSLKNVDNTENNNNQLNASMQSNEKYSGFSFSLYDGEIVSVIDLRGNRETDIAELICGKDAINYNILNQKADKLIQKSDGKAQKQSIYYIPEVETQRLLIPNFSVEENITAAVVKDHSGFAGVINNAEIKNAASFYASKLKLWNEWDLDRLSLNILDELEKKRVILFRYQMANASVIVMNGFTKGLDMIAKKQIFEDIKEIAKSGCSIIFITPNITEALEIGDKILVCGNNNIIAEIKNSEISSINPIETLIKNIIASN